jgi:diadenosine tetraphosphate (Ap4A) HIT family hydrolase
MVRILVCGNAGEELRHAASKLASLCAKSGPFEYALLTNPPLPDSPSAKLPVGVRFPIPTYYAAQYGCDAVELASANLTCVGPVAVLSLSGLTVVLLAAGYDDPPPNAKETLPPEIGDVQREAGVYGSGFRGVDIFVCPTLPRGVTLDPASDAQEPSTLVAHLARTLRPRYHFGLSKTFSALAPFLIQAAVHGTRFIALANVAKVKAGRWLYAADVTPLRHMSAEELAATRPGPELSAPYDDGQLKRSRSAEGPNARKLSDVVSRPEKRKSRSSPAVDDSTERGKRPRSRVQGMVETPADANCWFCLGNGKDPHLIISVGDDFYLAAAKGGIVPEHFLIVPILHLRNSADPEVSDAMREEIAKLKQAVAAFYKATLRGALPYFFERAVRTRGGESQMHMHVHCIPIPTSAVADSRTRAVAAAELFNVHLEFLPAGKDFISASCAVVRSRSKDRSSVADGTLEYFWAELPDGTNVVQAVGDRLDVSKPGDGETKAVATMVKTGEVAVGLEANDRADAGRFDAEKSQRRARHPLHFGRKIAADLLQLPNRIDWKLCVGAMREEERTAARLREAFASFEPKS